MDLEAERIGDHKVIRVALDRWSIDDGPLLTLDKTIDAIEAPWVNVDS